MSTVSLGDDFLMTMQKASVETITEYAFRSCRPDSSIREHLSDKRRELIDIMGDWFLGDWSRDELLELDGLMARLESELPAPIAHWNEDWKPVFLKQFSEFRQLLSERLGQL